MARTKRRGRKSFENSYKQRRKVYNRYVRMAKKKKEKLGDNIRIMEYSDFKANYTEYRRRMKEVQTGEVEVPAGSIKNPTLSNFIEETILVTRSQARSAAENYNNKIDDIKAKIANDPDYGLNEIEAAIYGDYLYYGYMTQSDVRGKSKRYEEIYETFRIMGLGNEAFGS